MEERKMSDVHLRNDMRFTTAEDGKRLEEPHMLSRVENRRLGKTLACMALLILPAVLNGCVFYIEHLVPHHGNVGDRVALRNPAAIDYVPIPLQVLFNTTVAESIVRQRAEEIVVEIPADLGGNVLISVWLGDLPISNILSFEVDTQPIQHRILGFGDSLMGPWAFHHAILDNMLNDHVGPSLVINEGKAGETLAEGAARFPEVLSTHAGLQYVYILQGANDIHDEKNTPIGEMLASLDQMVNQATAHSIYPILLTLPPRTGGALLKDQTWPTTEDWNDALRGYIIANNIDHVDLYQAFLAQPDWESFLDDDGLHLIAEGHEFIGELMYSAIAPLLN
jgi:lysophospholipase L1-like esterase